MNLKALEQENTQLKNQLSYYKEIAEYCYANHLHLKNLKSKEERDRDLNELRTLLANDQQNGFNKLNKITGNLKSYKIQLDLLQKEMDNLNRSYNDTYTDYKEYRDTVLNHLDYDPNVFDDKYLDENRLQYIAVDDQPKRKAIKENVKEPLKFVEIEEIQVKKDEVINLFTPRPHDRVEITDGSKVAPTPALGLDEESKRLKNKIIKHKKDRNSKRGQIDTSMYASDQQVLQQVSSSKILELEHYYLSNNLFLSLEPTIENFNYVDHLYGPLSYTTNKNTLNNAYNNNNLNDNSYIYCPIPISNEIEYLSSLVTTTAFVDPNSLEAQNIVSYNQILDDGDREIDQISQDGDDYYDDDITMNERNTQPTMIPDNKKTRKAYLFHADLNKKFNTIPHGDQ